MMKDPTATEETAATPVNEGREIAPAGLVDFNNVQSAPPASFAEALDRLDVETARRLHAEEALRESESRFRQLSEHAGKFLWMSDPETEELIYVSPGYEQVWARMREGSYSSPQDWMASFGGSRAPKSAPLNREEIYQVAGPDGAVCWIRDRMFPVRDSSGQVVRMLGIAEDITDAKRAKEALEALQSKCRALLAASPDMMFRVRKDGTVLEHKPSADSGLVLAEADVVGKTVKHLLPSSLATEAMQHLHQAVRGKQVNTFTCQYLVRDEVRDFEVRAAGSASDEAIVVIRDITDRKRLEREILEVASREQQRIGQDLHDSLGQHLTGITFMTKVLERKLAARNSEEAKEAAEIGRLVIQALAQTRNLARGLFPAELEKTSLVAALGELAAGVERMCKVHCSFKVADGVAVQDNILATHVFRIAQEAVNNAVKHSKATHIDVLLAAAGDRLELSVTDNGSGFPPEAKMDGLGLRIMHYRARRIGGTLEVKPAEKGGTRVTCSFRNKYESN